MDDLDDIAAGDQTRLKALRDGLTQLANGRNELLREMATAVLDGSLSLRDAVASSTYGHELTTPFREFWTRYEGMTPQERDQLTAESPARQHRTTVR
jgi:hypothetical protein